MQSTQLGFALLSTIFIVLRSINNRIHVLLRLVSEKGQQYVGKKGGNNDPITTRLYAVNSGTVPCIEDIRGRIDMFSISHGEPCMRSRICRLVGSKSSGDVFPSNTTNK